MQNINRGISEQNADKTNHEFIDEYFYTTMQVDMLTRKDVNLVKERLYV